MTPAEALQFIDNALAAVAGTRADHIRVLEAVDTIRAALPKDEPDATQL